MVRRLSGSWKPDYFMAIVKRKNEALSGITGQGFIALVWAGTLSPPIVSPVRPAHGYGGAGPQLHLSTFWSSTSSLSDPRIAGSKRPRAGFGTEHHAVFVNRDDLRLPDEDLSGNDDGGGCGIPEDFRPVTFSWCAGPL